MPRVINAKSQRASLPGTRGGCSTWTRGVVRGAEGHSRHIEDLTWTGWSAWVTRGQGVGGG